MHTPHVDAGLRNRGLLVLLLLALLGACEDPYRAPAQSPWDASFAPHDASTARDATGLSDGQASAAEQDGGASLDAGGGELGPLKVATTQGLLLGKSVGSTRLFLGVPYAEPPLGVMRFALPVPASGWEGTRDATAYGPACPQPSDATGALGPKSEDCLFLNVAAPISAERAPVMVFLHGGGLHVGAGSDYPPEHLSEAGGVVVVTVNYRLGALGFLMRPELDDDLGVSSGNLGLRDQQLALQWVRDNIAAFGGDPENVTLLGESAGAISVCLHMFIPSSAGLAHRFVLESGTCLAGPLALRERSQLAALSDELVASLCAEREDVLACLRELPADQLGTWMSRQVLESHENARKQGFDPPNNQDWFSYVDGEFVTASTQELLAAGTFEHKPVIVGSNLHEWGLIQYYGFPKANSVLEFILWVQLLHPEFASELITEYFPASDAEANLALESIWTDEWFRCPARALARAFTERGIPTYVYSYDVAPALHSQELEYVFGAEIALPRGAARELDVSLVDVVQGYWTQFARTGDPNRQGLPEWAVYAAEQDAHLRLATPVTLGSRLAEQHCDLWDTLWARPAN